MRRRIATAAATAAALLLIPAPASAAEGASVSGGVLSYESGDATVDTVTLAPGPSGSVLIGETSSPEGLPGYGCIYYAADTFRCFGPTSAVLETLDGDDTVTLTADLPTTVRGGAGTDTIVGGPAADMVEAGDDADVIDVRGGGTDTVDCGAGIDAVQADPGVDVLTNCDAPPPEPPVAPPADEPVVPAADAPLVPAPVAPALPDPLAPVDVGSRPVPLFAAAAVKVGANGVATFDLTCPAGQATDCEGSVFLDPAPRAKGKPRALAARRGRYGRGRFDVASGSKAKVKLRLSASARGALGLPTGRKARAARRGRRVKAVVTVAERGKKPVKSKVKLHR